jgi:hypothetical protein
LSDEEYDAYLKKMKISWESRFGKEKSDQMKKLQAKDCPVDLLRKFMDMRKQRTLKDL